ncbi:hypothetical protein [Numidum massiliense]|uniref:hypothetical protein n=1 Tax=Numidum massiliense TaxID=1522315 RepID=UPI0006D56B0E|nr:hypothetical protein [Numidum massiliense]
MHCTKCGKELKNNPKFCYYCGHDLRPQEGGEESEQAASHDPHASTQPDGSSIPVGNESVNDPVGAPQQLNIPDWVTGPQQQETASAAQGGQSYGGQMPQQPYSGQEVQQPYGGQEVQQSYSGQNTQQPHGGHKVQQPYGAQAMPQQGGTQQQFQGQAPGKQQQGQNAYLEKGKQLSQNFFEFFLEMIKAPAKGLAIKSDQYVNGYILMGIVALFYPFGMFFRQVHKEADAGEAFVDFLINFLYFAILLVATAGIIFGLAKLMKANVSFHDAVARFGAMLTVPVALYTLYLLFHIVGLAKVNTFIAPLASFSIVIAIALVVYSYKQEGQGGLDPLFALLIMYVAHTIINSISSEKFYIQILGTVFSSYSGVDIDSILDFDF